jgi:hypothetical protein
MGHVVHSSASVVRNVDTLFFMLWWAGRCFHKKCTATCYVELVFLESVGSAGLIVDSDVSEM